MEVAMSALEPYAVTIQQTAASEGTSVSNVYNRLASGEYRGVKDGRRTLVLWESIKARRAKLTPAKFGNPQPQNLRRTEAATIR
jgi:hypothetical protein